MSKPRVKLENWLDFGTSIAGNAVDHPRFSPGTFVRTSHIVERRAGEIETLNTIYLPVGDPQFVSEAE